MASWKKHYAALISSRSGYAHINSSHWFRLVASPVSSAAAVSGDSGHIEFILYGFYNLLL